ncbi:MAG: hypothetical protein DMF00_02970, partial [Verrucomicrobia bacterium]
MSLFLLARFVILTSVDEVIKVAMSIDTQVIVRIPGIPEKRFGQGSGWDSATERVASIDTGHTTAHLTYITDVELRELARNFGEDHAQAAWDAGAAAIDEIERIVGEEKIECEYTRVPAYIHVCVGGPSKKEAPSLKKEADLAAKLGFDAVYLESAPYFNLPAVRFANQAKFHPRKYLRSLVKKIPGNGSYVFEKSAASEFDAKQRRVKVNRNWISFDRVVMATN